VPFDAKVGSNALHPIAILAFDLALAFNLATKRVALTATLFVAGIYKASLLRNSATP
jgi:hypothetical protein